MARAASRRLREVRARHRSEARRGDGAVPSRGGLRIPGGRREPQLFGRAGGRDFSVYIFDSGGRGALRSQSTSFGNHVYANRLGNGNETSGDGFRFRGRGLIQLTGRTEYTEFGNAIGKSPEEVSDFCETPEGAAMSGCWYLATRGCLPFADAWNIDKITLLANGRAMVDKDKRRAFSNAFLSQAWRRLINRRRVGIPWPAA